MSTKMIVITGASSGLGRALAYECAEAGYVPILLARSRDGLIETADGITAFQSVCVVADLAEDAAGAAVQVRQEVRRHGGQLFGIVNNAGTARQGLFIESEPDVLVTQLRVNLEAAIVFTRLLLPDVSPGGVLLNVASTAGLCPGPGMALYYASKAGLVSWSRALEFELKPRGITVTTFCPGPLRTGFAARAGVARREHLASAPTAGQAARAAAHRMFKRGGLMVYPRRFAVMVLLQRCIPGNLAIAIVEREQRRRAGY